MRVTFLGAVLAVAFVLTAGGAGFAQADETVPIYTNEDLERLAPIPTPPGEPPTPEEIARRWAFVQSVLDQAHARVDADRRHELDRRMTEAQADALDRAGTLPRYTLPYSYLYGPVYRNGRGPHGRPHPAASAAWERPNAEQFRPITPIHARPYQSNLPRIDAGRGGGRHARP